MVDFIIICLLIILIVIVVFFKYQNRKKIKCKGCINKCCKKTEL